MSLFDFNDPFFKPLWLRMAVVGVPATWGVFEILYRSPGWGLLFLAFAAMGFHGLFLKFNPRDRATKESKAGRDDEDH